MTTEAEPHCHMSGHTERGCPGWDLDRELHIDLMRKGYGVSRIGGPSDAEVDAEGLAMRRRLPHQQ